MPGSTNRSQSGHSVSSFSSAPSRESVVSRLEDGATSELMEWGEGVVVGIFGVLFTIVKERYNTGVRFLLVKLALDFCQLFMVVFRPVDGWVIDQDLWLWKILRVLQFEDFIKPRGYSVFLAALYIMISLLGVALALAFWVAWCFQHRNFPFVWPIKLLRVYANIFFHVLDVATLTLLQLPFDCRWVGYPKQVRNILAIFPGVVCTEMPHVAHMAVAGVALAVFLAMAMLNLMADFELNPTTRNLYATANSEVEVRAFVIKFLMTVASYAVGWERIQVIMQFLLSTYLTWIYLKWQPHLFGWVNHLRVGLNASIATTSLGAVILVFHKEGSYESRNLVTRAFLAIIGPAMCVAAIVSYVRLTWWTKFVLMRYRMAPAGQKAKRIYKFKDSREVEIVARVCRKWTDQHYEVLDRGVAKEAEIVIKGGMQLFPGDAFMIITYVNLLIDVLESTQTGYSQLQAAKKCSPNLMERFAIFAREQEHMQRASGAKSGESSVDLVSYVEYQRNHRLVMRAHRSALVAIRNFWQLLLHNTVAFTSLAKALHRIERSVNVAEIFYRSALSRYPASPKLLRGYGKFLEAVKNNPWKAAKYFSEAEKLQDMQQQDEATLAVIGAEEGGMGGNGAHMLHRVDERVNIVFLINSAGIIQMANKNACSLLGYGKGELDGKNINTIMPPPFSQRHNRYIRQYIQTGRERVISSVNSVVALHKARYVLPVKLAVSKVSGATEDSIFMGVLEPVPVDPCEAHLYMLPNGVVTAMDQAFAEWMGYEMGDILGKDVATMVLEPGPLKDILPKFDPIALARMSRVTANGVVPGGLAVNGAGGGSTNPSAGKFGTMSMGLSRGMGMGLHASTPPQGSANPLPDSSISAGPETLASVQFLHKYTRPVDCCVSMQRLGIGPVECMVEVTLRRNGPAHLLALTGPSGRVRYIASELARALGTSPSALYRQPLGDIMPQPWGTLHAAWIKSMGGLGTGGGSSSAIVPGSCRSGITTVLGSSLRMQGYYRLAISSNDDSGEMRHVVEAQPSTREAALAERRLVLTVDADGIVTEVDDGPAWLYGFAPSQLLGRSLADVVTTLRPARGTGSGAEAPPAGTEGAEKIEDEGPNVSVTELLSLLISKAMMQNGVSWRVGVTVPTDEQELRALGPMRHAVLAKRTTPAIMEIEVSLDTAALGRTAPSKSPSITARSSRATPVVLSGGDDDDAAAAATAPPGSVRLSLNGFTPGCGGGARASATGFSRLSTSQMAGGGGDNAAATPGRGGGGGFLRGLQSSSSGTPQSPGAAAAASLYGGGVDGGPGSGGRPKRASSGLSPGLGVLAAAGGSGVGVGVGGGSGSSPPRGPRAPRQRSSVSRVRRKSWIAVEGPNGGIMVVSGAAMEGGNTTAARASIRTVNTRASMNSVHSVGSNVGSYVPPSQGPGVADVDAAVAAAASGRSVSSALPSELDTVDVLEFRKAQDALRQSIEPTRDVVGDDWRPLSRPSQQDPPEALRLRPLGQDSSSGEHGPAGELGSIAEQGTAELLAAADEAGDQGADPPPPPPFEAEIGVVPDEVGGDGVSGPGALGHQGAYHRGLRGQEQGVEEPEFELLPGAPVGDEAAAADGEGDGPRERTGEISGQSPRLSGLSRPPSVRVGSVHGGSVHGGSVHGGSVHGGSVHGGSRGKPTEPALRLSAPTMSYPGQPPLNPQRSQRNEDTSTFLLKKLLSARVSQGAANGPYDSGMSCGQEDLLGPLLPLLVSGSLDGRGALAKLGTNGGDNDDDDDALHGFGGFQGFGTNEDLYAAFGGYGGDGDDGDDCSVELPLSVADDARVVVIRVSLWRADLLTPVLEMDAMGGIAAMIGDDLAPPGLLFGVPTNAMMSRPLHSFLELQDRSVAGLFHDPGIAKRGGLKTTAKEANKIGNLREVTGRHTDAQPLELTLQAVVKESAPSRTYVVLKPRKPSRGSRAALLHSVRDLGLMLSEVPEEGELQQQQLAFGSVATSIEQPGLSAQLAPGAAAAVPVGVSAAAAHVAMAPVRDQATLRLSFDSNRSRGEVRAPLALPAFMDRDSDAEMLLTLRKVTNPSANRGTAAPPPPWPAGVVAVFADGAEHPFGVVAPAAAAVSYGFRSGSPATNDLQVRVPAGATERRPPPLSPRVDSCTPLLPFDAGFGGDAADNAKPHAALSDATRSSIGSFRDGGLGPSASPSGSDSDSRGDPVRPVVGRLGSPGAPPAVSPVVKATGKGLLSRAGSGKLGPMARQSSGSLEGTPRQLMASGGAADGVDANDDNASDVSGGSAVSEVMDASGPTADYRRGKRYRKLLKVLESPGVQRAARDFQWQALMANVAQLVTNLLAFILLTVLLQEQARHVDTLHAATSVNRLMHESFIIMQKLNNHHEGIYPAVPYYSASSVPELSSDLKDHIEKFADLVTRIYEGIGNTREDPTTPYNPESAQDIWNKAHHNETVFYTTVPYRIEFRNSSLWSMSSSFIERASEVQHMHSSWGEAHGTLADFDAYRWTMTNGLGPLYEGYSDALLQLTQRAIDQAAEVNRLQLVLLVLQGCVVCILLLIYMWWLQRRVSQQRYSLYSLFMLVPVGLLRALASKSVNVADNSDAEASSDEDRGADQATVGGGGYDAASGRASPAFNLVMKSSVVNNGGRGYGTDRTGLVSRFFTWSGRGSTAGNGSLPRSDSKGVAHSSSNNAAKRRHLVPSNYDSVSLLAPFVVWGVLICVLYAVGFIMLKNTTGPLALLSAHNIAIVRMHRLILYGLQLNSQAADAGKLMLQPILGHELRAFEREWDVLLYGANETLRQDRRFELCTTSTAFSDETLSRQAFRMDGCLASSPGVDAGACLEKGNSHYAATVHGVSMMVDRFMEDVAYLARQPLGLIALNNTHLDYIMVEGEANIETGINTVAKSLVKAINSLYKQVGLLQIFSLVLSWLLAVAFIFMQLRPFVRGNRVETQRIARMLSELPPEVDIEGIVARVLLRDLVKDGGGHLSQANMSAPSSGGGPQWGHHSHKKAM